jgi:hypothetical protein
VDGPDRIADTKLQPRWSIQWPRRFLGPPPGLIELNLGGWGLFFGFLVVPVLGRIWLDARAGSMYTHLLPFDFIYFYGIGQIANEYPLSKLYDYALQLKVFNAIYPITDGAYGPSPYPPFVALFFSLFARLPLLPAYILWVFATLALYIAGIGVVVKEFFQGERLKISLIISLALAFYPFSICTLKNGQLAAIAVFSVGLAIYQERHSRAFISGLALSLLAYKPTLLFFIVPMLLITRRFKALGGFIAGAIVFALVAVAFGGIDIWVVYLHFLSFFRNATVVHGQSMLQLWEYVDFTSFSYAVPGGRSSFALGLLTFASSAIATALAILLYQSAKCGKPVQSLAWASTLTWTLLLNLYVPVWDSILVVIGIVLTVGALRELGRKATANWIIFLALLMFAVSWNLAAKGNRHGSQMMMILLFILGLAQLSFLYRAIHNGEAQDIPEPAAGSVNQVASSAP